MSDDVIVTFEIALPEQAAHGFASMGGHGLEATKAFPGCKSVRIVEHKDDPARFLFVECWESEDAYHNYIAWRTDRGEFQALQSMANSTVTNIWPRTVASV